MRTAQRTGSVGALLVATVMSAAIAAGCGTGRALGSDAAPGDDSRGPYIMPPHPSPFFSAPGNDVDILLVIDNSGSTLEWQLNFVHNFSRLLDALRHVEHGSADNGKPCSETSSAGCAIPNVHIGVISTDLGAGTYGLPSCEQPSGDGGRLLDRPHWPGCQPPADKYVSYIEGKTNIPGVTGDTVKAVADAVSCIAPLGTDGCGFEMPLEAMYRALQPIANPGFLRNNAALAVIILSDEDDCSARRSELFDPSQDSLDSPLGPLTSFRCFEHGITCDEAARTVGEHHHCKPGGDYLYGISRYVDFLRQLKDDPADVLVSAIAAPTRVEVGRDGDRPVLKASCTSSSGIAAPAVRTRAFVDAFGPRGLYSDICAFDYGPALEAFGKLIGSRLADLRASAKN